MSSLVHFEYAPPKSWEQFEELCADLFSEMWNDQNAVRYGRAGQSQQGVDILISNGSLFPIGLQCKKKSIWPAKKLKFSEVEAEISKAENFMPALEQYYILTTAESDANLISKLAELNINRLKENKFKVTVLSWSEILARVAKYENVINKHFNMGGGGDYSPLISTWYINNGKIELDDDMWEIEVKESSMDLVDCPNGHIVIRQRETDELLKHVKMFPKSNDLESREELYQLKKALQKEILKEKVVSNYIKQILLNKVLIDSIVEIEFNPEDYYLHDVIATIIENKFSVKHKNEELKIFLSPPNVTEWAESEDLKFRELVIRAGYNRETLLLPSNIYRQLLEVEGKFKEKYGSEMSKVVLELPINIKAKYVIPKILLIIIDIMEKSGKNINALKKSGLLDLNSWVFEYY